MAIRMESVSLGVAFVGSAVFSLDLEKEILHFPQRSPVHFGGELFRRMRELGLSPSQQAGNVFGITSSGKYLPFGRDGRFKVTDALIGLLQPNGFGGLRAAQHLKVHLRQAWSEKDFFGVVAF